MWDAIVEGAKSYPQLGFLRQLFDRQLGVYERCEELLMGERRPLEPGVLMAFLAFVSKTHRELFPIVEESAPEPFRGGVANLRRATGDDLLELLTVYYLDDRIPKAALQHLPDEALCRWFARMLLQPAAPCMLSRTVGDASAGPRCPRCRHRPQLSTGSGVFQCSLCFFEWPESGRCPACGGVQWRPESAWISCGACRSFLKRVNGLVPIVEELASTDLDDRARELGLRKIEANLLLR